MLTLVFCGSFKARTEGIVGIESTAVVREEGLMGVTGREWERYQAKTLCPNFEGSVDAPTTAKRGLRKKRRI